MAVAEDDIVTKLSDQVLDRPGCVANEVVLDQNVGAGVDEREVETLAPHPRRVHVMVVVAAHHAVGDSAVEHPTRADDHVAGGIGVPPDQPV
jgi:hypothetical protein